VASSDVLQTILAEIRLGYGILALGTSETASPDQLLSAVVDDVLIWCPIPMVVARGPPPATTPAVDGRPFLGHTVEHVLAHAGCAVVVAVLPSRQTTDDPSIPPPPDNHAELRAPKFSG